jgi:hypothetical protein
MERRSTFPGSRNSTARHTSSLVAGAGLGAPYALTANCSASGYTATCSVSDATNFVALDWVLITAEDTYPYTAALVKRGEIKQVQGVTSGAIRCRQAVYDNYTTANTARIQKVNFIEDVSIEGLTIKGKNTEGNRDVGIEVEYVNKFRIAGCKFKDIDQEAIRVYNSIRGDIEGNWFDGVRYSGSGLLFYAVVLYNCAQWINVRNNYGHELRHLVTTSATATKYGEPYFCFVSGNIMENAQAGDSFASWAYENHGFGRWITWAHNLADSCHTGLNIERGDQVVIGNIFRNCRFNGVLFSSDGRDLSNILVSGNLISGTTADPDAPAGQARAISFEAQAASVRRNIRISGNVIANWGDVGRSACFAIRVEAGSGSAINCVIDGNTFDNGLSYRSADFGIRIEQTGWQVARNAVNGYERAAYLAANDISFHGNEVSVQAAASTNRAVEVRGNNIAVTCNTFRGAYQAVFIAAGATSSKVAGNTQYGTTVTAVADSGTSTVLNYGATSGF